MWSPSLGAKIARAWAAALNWFAHAWVAVLTWFKRSWQDLLEILSFVVGVLGLVWVANLINKLKNRRYERMVRIVVCGAVSAGKTGLWKELQKKFYGGKLPASAGAKSARLPSVPYGPYTLFPAATDIAGSDPELLSWALKSAEDGINSRSHRMKRILIFVASPSPQDTVISNDAIDGGYVAEQKGYASLPMSIIAGDDDSARPHLVIMFVSKFDLVSKADPEDTSSTQVRKLVEDKFREHRRLIEDACGKKQVPFAFFVGSALKGWRISELKERMQEVING